MVASDDDGSSPPLFLSDPDPQFPNSKDATSERERCSEAEDGDNWFKGAGLSGLRYYMSQLRPVGGCSRRGSGRRWLHFTRSAMDGRGKGI
ncbi:unnamed protein product [Linum trigynum]|uniref:Uncharacterized protein n=1 Tax=Linum trigynum TaxID=586398 RepID=A0AAV2CIA5_9ROSI